MEHFCEFLPENRLTWLIKLIAFELMRSEELAVIERETAELKPDIDSRELRLRARRIMKAAKRLQSQLQAKVSSSGALLSQAKGERIVAELQGAEGGAWSGAELAHNFGLSAAVLHRRRREYRIVYWRNAQHDYFYPRWQFNEAGAMLPGIQEILRLFRSRDEWRVMRYFLCPRKQLGDRRPLDILRAGDVATVVNHARAHVAENTW